MKEKFAISEMMLSPYFKKLSLVILCFNFFSKKVVKKVL